MALLNSAGAGGLAQVTGVFVGAAVVATDGIILIWTGHFGAGGAFGVAQFWVHNHNSLITRQRKPELKQEK